MKVKIAFVLGVAVFILVLLLATLGLFVADEQPTATLYHLSTFTAEVQRESWGYSHGDPDLSVAIILHITPENARYGYGQRVFTLPTFPVTLTATWELPYIDIPGEPTLFVEYPEFILGPGDTIFVYLVNTIAIGEAPEKSNDIIAQWILTEKTFTLPLILIAANGATLIITGTQEPVDLSPYYYWKEER